MPPIGSLGISAYNDLLKAGAGGSFFKTALYPPVLQQSFNVGTVFTFQMDGTIDAHGTIVSSPRSTPLIVNVANF